MAIGKTNDKGLQFIFPFYKFIIRANTYLSFDSSGNKCLVIELAVWGWEGGVDGSFWLLKLSLALT